MNFKERVQSQILDDKNADSAKVVLNERQSKLKTENPFLEYGVAIENLFNLET